MPSKARIRFIASLSRKKTRDDSGLFVAEGPRVIAEMLQADNITPVEIYGTAQWMEEACDILNNRPELWRCLDEIDESDLKKMSSLVTANKVIGVFEQPRFILPPNYKNCLTLMLETIQDPGNLGSVIRSADWFGVNHIVCSRECVDAFNPKVIQSTMGSIARVSIQYENLEDLLDQYPEIPLMAATLHGDDLYRISPVKEAFLLIGNEARGISDSLLERATRRVTIPRKGQAESLNAAVATGILLSCLTGTP